MTINIFVLKGGLNGGNCSGAFLFLSGIYSMYIPTGLATIFISKYNLRHSCVNGDEIHVMEMLYSSLKGSIKYNQPPRLKDAVFLTRCYTQHALRPYIDSEINHIRYFEQVESNAFIYLENKYF